MTFECISKADFKTFMKSLLITFEQLQNFFFSEDTGKLNNEKMNIWYKYLAPHIRADYWEETLRDVITAETKTPTIASICKIAEKHESVSSKKSIEAANRVAEKMLKEGEEDRKKFANETKDPSHKPLDFSMFRENPEKQKNEQIWVTCNCGNRHHADSKCIPCRKKLLEEQLEFIKKRDNLEITCSCGYNRRANSPCLQCELENK